MQRWFYSTCEYDFIHNINLVDAYNLDNNLKLLILLQGGSR